LLANRFRRRNAVVNRYPRDLAVAQRDLWLRFQVLEQSRRPSCWQLALVRLTAPTAKWRSNFPNPRFSRSCNEPRFTIRRAISPCNTVIPRSRSFHTLRHHKNRCSQHAFSEHMAKSWLERRRPTVSPIRGSTLPIHNNPDIDKRDLSFDGSPYGSE
jgi:hypothetical protein